MYSKAIFDFFILFAHLSKGIDLYQVYILGGIGLLNKTATNLLTLLTFMFGVSYLFMTSRLNVGFVSGLFSFIIVGYVFALCYNNFVPVMKVDDYLLLYVLALVLFGFAYIMRVVLSKTDDDDTKKTQ